MNKKIQISLILLLVTFLVILGWVTLFKDDEHSVVESIAISMENEYDIELGATVAETINDIMVYFDVDENQIAIAYYDFVDGEHYYLNADQAMYAASTTKVAIAALYADLIENGIMDWDSKLPYYDSYYESGEGAVTNAEKEDAYPVDELILEMLIHSDNTATNVLAFYYIENFSGDFEKYRQAIAGLSGLDDLPDIVYTENYATARMLEQTLIHVANNDAYTFIIETMMEAQEGFRLKELVSVGMAAKYGSSEQWNHDMGIYYEDGVPIYAIVVMTEDVLEADEFMGILNFYLHKM
ncbi:serine hydrolase [Jeotgalibaca sp. A122]|uniref:serine hydrolase n=1 Tax=Jeotgalibaca sp. A122 TaxID=3457322 RepID=UPI003FD4638B